MTDILEETPSSWEELLKKLRPGSRTVLYRPERLEQVLELARRGFRLLVVHSDSDFRDECRQALRDEGLSSSLMGSHQLVEGRPLSLAKNFYDLVLSCSAPHPALSEIEAFLAPQGQLVEFD